MVAAGVLSFWAWASFGAFAQETAAQQRAGDGTMASRATALPTADPALEVLERRSEARVMGRYGGEGPAVSFGARSEVPGAALRPSSVPPRSTVRDGCVARRGAGRMPQEEGYRQFSRSSRIRTRIGSADNVGLAMGRGHRGEVSTVGLTLLLAVAFWYLFPAV